MCPEGHFSYCLQKKRQKKLALMSSFSFWMTLFSPLPHLPPSFPFGHIAYKSQAILVSGLQKAWPPGKACRTAVTCLIRPLLNSSLCICVCALELFFFFFLPSLIHPCTHPFSPPFCSCTAQEQVCCALLPPYACCGFCWLAHKSSRFPPAPVNILVYSHTWAR